MRGGPRLTPGTTPHPAAGELLPSDPRDEWVSGDAAMRQRITAMAGGLLLVTSCLASLYLSSAVANAYLAGIFSTIVTDSPAQDFQAFNCPLLLGRHETSQVSVSIANTTSSDLTYAITIAADGLAIDSPAREQTATIPSQQTVTQVWPVTAVAAGNRAIVVQAASAYDAALPGPFHSWPTSYRQGCGVLVLDTSLSGSQVMGLIGIGALAGTALSIPWLARRRRRSKTRERA